MSEVGRPWHALARPNQRPPTDFPWSVFAISAGRGFGKTRSAAEWLAEQAATNAGSHYAVIAPTWRDCRNVCMEGCSGVLVALREAGDGYKYDASQLLARLANGSTINGYPADNLDRVTGLRFDGVWIEELGSIGGSLKMWNDHVAPALKGGGKTFITTTPPENGGLPCPLLSGLLHGEGPGPVIHVKGSSWASDVSQDALNLLRGLYPNTRLDRPHSVDVPEGLDVPKKTTLGVRVHRSSLPAVMFSGELRVECDDQHVLRVRDLSLSTIAVFAATEWKFAEVLQEQPEIKINIRMDEAELKKLQNEVAVLQRRIKESVVIS